MLRQTDNESEILLGNKQLLGIFFAVAILLGVAFYGGYMVGRGSSGKRPAPTVEAPTASLSSQPAATGGETHTLPAEPGGNPVEAAPPSPAPDVVKSNPGSHELAGSSRSETPLGARKRAAAIPESKTAEEDGYMPQPGTQYLQVVAIARSEAEGLADVLHKKGFRAHAVPKPGNAALYRVIVGPIRDAGDLSSTREALRKTGFRQVIVQRY